VTSRGRSVIFEWFWRRRPRLSKRITTGFPRTRVAVFTNVGGAEAVRGRRDHVPAADYSRVTRLADKPATDASPARLGKPGFSATSRTERVDGVRGGAVAMLDAPQRREPPPRRRGERLRRRRHRHAVYKHRLPRGQGFRHPPGGRAAAAPRMALRRCGSSVRRPQMPQRRQRKPPLQLLLRGFSTETRRGKRSGRSIAAAGCLRRRRFFVYGAEGEGSRGRPPRGPK